MVILGWGEMGLLGCLHKRRAIESRRAGCCPGSTSSRKGSSHTRRGRLEREK